MLHNHLNLKNTNTNTNLINETKNNDIIALNIFPNTLFFGNINVDNDKIVSECYKLKTIEPIGKPRSNRNGWQSDRYSSNCNLIRNQFSEFINLELKCLEFVNCAMAKNGYTLKFLNSRCTWWVNINQEFSYNVIHCHPKCEWVAVYYPKIESKKQGELTFVRTDGSNHNAIYENAIHEYMQNYYVCPIEQGKLYVFPSHLLHYVTPNMTKNDRISISFNFSI